MTILGNQQKALLSIMYRRELRLARGGITVLLGSLEVGAQSSAHPHLSPAMLRILAKENREAKRIQREGNHHHPKTHTGNVRFLNCLWMEAARHKLQGYAESISHREQCAKTEMWGTGVHWGWYTVTLGKCKWKSKGWGDLRLREAGRAQIHAWLAHDVK